MDLIHTHNLGLKIIMIGTLSILRWKDHNENRIKR